MEDIQKELNVRRSTLYEYLADYWDHAWNHLEEYESNDH